MRCVIETTARNECPDVLGNQTLSAIRDLHIDSVEAVRTVRVYHVEGDFDLDGARTLAGEILADPVVERHACGEPLDIPGATRTIEVRRRPGVMDPVAQSVVKAAADLGIRVTASATSEKYLLFGNVSDEQVEQISRILANDCIEETFLDAAHRSPLDIAPPATSTERIDVPLRDADDDELAHVSKRGHLFLNVEEMRTIQRHFREMGRDPTDVELETLAQTWSEHCAHKTLRGRIRYEGHVIDNLLKQTVMKVTRDLDKPWCVSVFKDNAGVIEFDERYHVCFKVETHNHPSAIEPYGGAGTGIGGVIRDPLGTGLGATPILNTDIFCFGPPDMDRDALPRGVLHPKRIFKGVVGGVRDYGNRMGIPTANGAIFFDDRYVGNPLVYCGNIGLIPVERAEKEAHTGDKIVVVGGRTGRDGIHGATFSSGELEETSETTFSSAVQIGNPIAEKKVVDTLVVARDRGLYSCITDCGAGGLSSAVGEMGEELGAVVDIETVPLKYEGLSYTEIWISEAQERMVLAVPPENVADVLNLFESEDVEATVIGEFTDTRRLHLRFHGQTVADLDMDFLHNGIPRITRDAVWAEPGHPDPELTPKTDYAEDLKRILGSWNVCSKEWVIRQYDHEVQGASVLKPLQGVDNDGPGDACVIAPVPGSWRGIVVSNGMNPRYGDVDPYAMAASAIDECLRQITAVGAPLDRVVLLDNFCWGNTDKPDRLGSLVRAALACRDVALAYGAPFISGKDSLNNEYAAGGTSIAIPPSLLISGIAVMPDVRKAVSMDAKAPGNPLYVVGVTKDELGGSHYYALHDAIGRNAPQVDTELGPRILRALHGVMATGCVAACHDCSEGGIAVAAAEMAFAGGVGLEVGLGSVPTEGALRDVAILFSESNSRFLVEVKAGRESEFEAGLAGVPFGRVGRVADGPDLVVTNAGGGEVVRESWRVLKDAWQAPLAW